MGHSAYSYNKDLETRYTFISHGKRDIKKVVEFTLTSVNNLYNLGFGDLLENDTVDDVSNSNNGDIITVLATVVDIVKEFTSIHPDLKIVFTGSTQERTRLYKRILKTNLSEFDKDYIISALIKTGNSYKEVKFETDSEIEYFAFFIKKII